MAATVNVNVGSHVWVEEPESSSTNKKKEKQVLPWIDGEVSEIDGQVIHIQTPNGKKVEAKVSEVFPKDTELLPAGVDDMTKLTHVHEPGVLQNLATRYQRNQIYTYAGNILIAINPFQILPRLYDAHMMEKYKEATFGELSPHVFTVADVAYRSMMKEGKSTSIIVTGESGAGKTETTKLLMRYLAYVGGHSGTEGPTIEERLLESNVVLESFGNAKTVQNHNSSRFGKFVEIQFDKSGRISGAAIRTYLLERSRVCKISDLERNYHCFYRLCAAPSDDIANYRLENPKSFHYLNQSDSYELDGVSDAHEYLATRRAMDFVGISKQEQEKIFRILAAILHLGNIEFSKGKEIDSSIIKDENSRSHLNIAAELLMCNRQFLEDALIYHIMVTPTEVIRKNIDPVTAVFRRDSLAKAIYSGLFTWIVDKINISIGQDPQSKSIIGVLDINGFECVKCNSFEQFCANFTNEKLQQHFNQHIFKMEQEEYTKEEIKWNYIEFIDNQDVLDLIEKKPGGIIALLDEACMFPKSTHETFAQKLYTTFKNNKHFSKPKLSRTDFTISHCAGEVTYKADQFLDKNKDYVVAEHQEILSALKFLPPPPELEESSIFSSSNVLPKKPIVPLKKRLSKVLSKKLSFVGKHQELPSASKCPPSAPEPEESSKFSSSNVESKYTIVSLRKGFFIVVSKIFSIIGRPTKSSLTAPPTKFSSTGEDFKLQLQSLMETLKSTEPHFIRCVKPNNELKPAIFENINVINQLRCGCVVEAIRISCAGYPTTYTFYDFLNRFGVLAPEVLQENFDERDACKKILEKMEVKDYQIGKTKVFLKDDQALDARRREVLSNAATTIQRQIRTYIARKEFVTLLKAAIHLQSLLRGKLARTFYEYLRREAAAVKIQKTFRQYVARKRYIALQMSAVTLQTGFRAMAAHKEFKSRKQIKAAMRIQAHWRCYRKCSYYKKLYEAKTQEISKLNNALRAKQLQLDKANARVTRAREEAQKDIEEIRRDYDDAEARIEGLKKKLKDAADAAVCEVDQLKESVLRLVRKPSETDSETEERPQKSLNEELQENQDLLIKCISEDLGYSGGRPVAACIIYKCLLHWRSFEAERTKVFDRIIQIIGAAIEKAQDNNDVLAYWLSNSSTLLLLLQRTLKAGLNPQRRRPVRKIPQQVGGSDDLRQVDAPQNAGPLLPPKLGGSDDLRQVEAKYPALLFKQQLTAFLEKIYGMIRDNLKKDISPLVGLCIQAPRTSRANAVAQQPLSAHWQSILKSLNSYLTIMKTNFVPPFLVHKVFTQIFSFINVQLFNSLLFRPECCSFSNGEYVKAGLAELEQWCFLATEEYAGSAWDEMKHIRQAVAFLVAHQKSNKTLKEITNDLCPVLSIQQLYRISTLYQYDKYGTHSVSSEVILNMRVLMTEDSNNAEGSSFLLVDDSSIPFSVEDISKSMQQIDMADIGPRPLLCGHSEFIFLSHQQTKT